MGRFGTEIAWTVDPNNLGSSLAHWQTTYQRTQRARFQTRTRTTQDDSLFRLNSPIFPKCDTDRDTRARLSLLQ